LKSIAQLLRKQRRLIVGLMSGTSADGTDAALVAVETLSQGPHAGRLTWELLDFVTVPYPPAVREEVLAVQEDAEGVLGRLTRLHFMLGHLYADAVEAVCTDGGIPLDTVDAVACHGQTVAHFPGSTLQIGEPAVLAERLGIPVVSDFRSRDMAVGGTGAPLVPLVDYTLFADPDRTRIALNVGGIANLTAIPAGSGREDVLAFDTGPGNMVIDALMAHLTHGRKHVDEGGALARRGTPHREVVDRVLEDPFFARTPPKAAGRGQFGEAFTRAFLDRCRTQKLSDAAIVATATWLTARSVQFAYERFVKPVKAAQEVIVSGGGAHNVALLEDLTACFEGVSVVTSDYYGLDIDAKEAVAFALLAHLSLNGEAGNLTGVTGASRPVVLGTLTPGDRFL
jgi:anhydro-N-acetylmuramic acid kinase